MAKIGVQAMMLKENVARDGAYATLQRVREIGFTSVEVSQIPMTAENVGEIARARDELGIEIDAISANVEDRPHVANDSLATSFDKIVADARTLGTRNVRIGMMPHAAMTSKAALLDFCATVDGFAQRLGEHGVQLYYHNHHIEFARYDGRHILDLIRDNAPHLKYEIDVHWVHRGGMHPQTVLEDYAGVVDLIHLKDYRIGPLSPEAFEAVADGDREAWRTHWLGVVQFAEVGEGNLDWAGIIDRGLASGAQHLFIEQDQQYGRDALDCLATSYDNLVALGYEHLM